MNGEVKPKIAPDMNRTRLLREMISRRLLVLLISIPFVEVAVTIFLTSAIGAGLTFSLFAIPTIIGLIIQWFRWKKIRLYWIEIKSLLEANARNENSEMIHNVRLNRNAMVLINFWLSVVLLLIPGFVTDIYAFYLIFSSNKNLELAISNQEPN